MAARCLLAIPSRNQCCDSESLFQARKFPSYHTSGTATGLVGLEGKLLDRTLKYCICYVAFLGVFVYLGSVYFMGR